MKKVTPHIRLCSKSSVVLAVFWKPIRLGSFLTPLPEFLKYMIFITSFFECLHSLPIEIESFLLSGLNGRHHKSLYYWNDIVVMNAIVFESLRLTSFASQATSLSCRRGMSDLRLFRLKVNNDQRTGICSNSTNCSALDATEYWDPESKFVDTSLWVETKCLVVTMSRIEKVQDNTLMKFV